MSILNRRSSTTANIDADLGELIARRSERTAEAEAAEARIAGEVIETGDSPSAKVAESLRRDAASIDRAIAAKEQERTVVASQEEEIRVTKAWRVEKDFGRHRIHHAAAGKALIEQLRVWIEVAIADDAKHKDMVPVLPEGFEHATPLDADLLAAVCDELHGANFRDHARRPSAAARINYRVALMGRERPDELHLGTQRLLKPSPSHDATET